MIRVKLIVLHKALKEILNKDLTIELAEGATIRDLIQRLDLVYKGAVSEILRIDKQVSILLNGQDIEHLGSLNKKLADGDCIAFIPLVAGG
ncbi:MAG: MoaD/ThiS family protein [Candidatus Bathyarchaeia archaeon]